MVELLAEIERVAEVLQSPVTILVVGIVIVIGMVVGLRMNAFIALVAGAVVVSRMSPGPWSASVARVAEAFGTVVGKIGIVIALAAVIGKCLMDSGAADRIVRSFLQALGEKRSSLALMGSGFVLSIPVFFDTVFYLLVPLARSLWRRTRKNYVLYVTAISAGAAITHTLVPPTPGPLFMANELNIDLGLMILMGTLIGLPTALIGLPICRLFDRAMNLPMRPYVGEKELEPLPDDELPPLLLSLAPVVLPVVLISANTVAKAIGAVRAVTVTAVIGDPNLALLLSAAIAMSLLVRYRGASLAELGQATETALMSGGVIILITAGGGAFGAMLREAGIEDVIQQYLNPNSRSAGVLILLTAFGVASLMKFAQGSGTVSMITTVSMFAAMKISPSMLGCHPVYLAAAIGCGSLVGSWMNDSGFWIYARMGNLTELESLRTWTILLIVLGVIALGITLVLSRLMPLLQFVGA
ncbi:MAG TPA: gluconate permease [Planctomycetaceae bacterium]|nr:gluconate permease [Planctomycetaceae bacterium]